MAKITEPVSLDKKVDEMMEAVGGNGLF